MYRGALDREAGRSIFFFNDTATTEIYTLSLHDALPICARPPRVSRTCRSCTSTATAAPARSEEHTSELQSQSNLVCRLLLEKKNITAYCPYLTLAARPYPPRLLNASLHPSPVTHLQPAR